MSDTSSRPLLNWLLRRGPHTLAFQVSKKRSRYQVSIVPVGARRRVRTELCRAGRSAFQLHAAWVAAFRDAGWTSVAYR
jgi:hypothetical protein